MHHVSLGLFACLEVVSDLYLMHLWKQNWLSEEPPINILHEGDYIWKSKNHIKTVIQNSGSHSGKVEGVQRCFTLGHRP